MTQIRHIQWSDLEGLTASPGASSYFAMYSSVWNGLVTDPALMLVPVDDHLVHRGDGVFETFKCLRGRLYNLDAHLRRLEASARAIELRLPWSQAEMVELIVQTVRAGGRRDALVRLLFGRGPGSLGAPGCGPWMCRSNLRSLPPSRASTICQTS